VADTGCAATGASWSGIARYGMPLAPATCCAGVRQETLGAGPLGESGAFDAASHRRPPRRRPIRPRGQRRPRHHRRNRATPPRTGHGSPAIRAGIIFLLRHKRTSPHQPPHTTRYRDPRATSPVSAQVGRVDGRGLRWLTTRTAHRALRGQLWCRCLAQPAALRGALPRWCRLAQAVAGAACPARRSVRLCSSRCGWPVPWPGRPGRGCVRWRRASGSG
jgi:hypothetical protein